MEKALHTESFTVTSDAIMKKTLADLVKSKDVFTMSSFGKRSKTAPSFYKCMPLHSTTKETLYELQSFLCAGGVYSPMTITVYNPSPTAKKIKDKAITMGVVLELNMAYGCAGHILES